MSNSPRNIQHSHTLEVLLVDKRMHRIPHRKRQMKRTRTWSPIYTARSWSSSPHQPHGSIPPSVTSATRHHHQSSSSFPSPPPPPLNTASTSPYNHIIIIITVTYLYNTISHIYTNNSSSGSSSSSSRKGHSLRKACLQPMPSMQNSNPRPPAANIQTYIPLVPSSRASPHRST